jgi:TonB-dependent receptor
VVVGARFEHTDFNWITSAPVTVVGTFGNIKYYDVLPSVNAKYKLMDKHYLRASYFSSLSRPGFYEVTPHTYVDPSSDYPEQGNPDLKRTTAENFDLRYEFFPKGADQILAGIFYKNIKNPIEYAIVQRGAGNTYYSPANFGTGSNYGFELDVTKYLHNFGLKANYTYTNSRITTSKVRRFQKTDGSGTSLTQEDVMQTRPLQGQSKNIANLSLLYKNNKHGVDIQVAGVYTGDRINTVSPFLNNDVWQKGTFQTDISGEVKLSQHFSAFGKANNIFNTKYELEIHQKNGDVSAIPYQKTGENAFVRKDSYGANYLMGIRFKL